MPGSVSQGKQDIKTFIESCPDIQTIVDVGAGSGTYPKLLGPKYVYKAVEIWQPYVDMFNLKDLYSEIIIGDAAEIDLPSGDLIIFGDVLEHMEKEKAFKLLSKALHDFQHVVLSVPLGHYPAKEHYGNKHENHISEWTFDELNTMAMWQVAMTSKEIGIFCV